MRPSVLLTGCVIAAAALLVGPLSSRPAGAAPPAAKPLVESYFKAKKDAARAKAWTAIEAHPALAADQLEALRAAGMKQIAKRAKVASKRSEWFDEDKDGWKGLYIPKRKKKKNGGLVLGMHGGGKGSGDCGSSASHFGGAIGSIGMSAVFPEVLVKTEYGWTDPPETERWVLELVKQCRLDWDVDPNRVYLTGHSMGGFGTWTYGGIYADVFAAGAAFAGAPSVYWKTGMKDVEAEGVVDGILPNLYTLPLYVYQSLDDVQVKAPANIKACAELKRLHAEDAGGWTFKYVEVDKKGHSLPADIQKEGLAWMASHVRDPRPKKLRWQPIREWKKTFYWIRWDDPWLGSVLVASIDRAANQVDITIERPHSAKPLETEAERETRVATLGVYVDERMLDVTKPVVITVDGKERFRGVPEARLATLVRSLEERADPEYGFARLLRLGPIDGR